MIQTRIFLHFVRMNLGIEPVLLVYSGLQSIVSHGLLRDVVKERICGEVNCTSEQCDQISSYHFYYRLLETVPSLLPCLILGGWSDYHGRLPLVMTVLCGDLLKNLIVLVQAVSTWDISYILIASGVSGITGNWPLMMLACLARCCDSTDTRGRTLRVGCLVGLWWLGQGCGYVVAAYRTADIDYYTHCVITQVAISVVLCIEVAIIVYTNICVQETVPDFGDYNGSGWRTIIMPIYISSTVNSVFRSRVHNARTCLLILIGVVIMNDFVIYGEQAVTYVYLSSKLGTSEFSYCLYYGGEVVLASIVVIFCLLITKKYEIQEATLGIVGSVLSMTTSLLLAAISINVKWPAYLVSLPHLFNLLVPTVALSLLSKVVHTSEIGAMLASVATMNSIFPFLGEISYKQLFSLYHSSLPEAMYLVSIVLAVILSMIFLFMKRTLNPCFGFYETAERVPLINHSDSYQATAI